MNSFISINATKSSLRSPIAFFKCFFNKKLFSKAKECFLSKFPNPQEENDLWNCYPVDIDMTNQAFSVEYILDIYNEEKNCLERNHIIEKYTFETEIEKLFRSEFEMSKKLIYQKYEPLTNEYGHKNKNLKEALLDDFKAIFKHLKQLKNTSFNDIEIAAYKRPLESLVRILYLKFRDFLPSPEVDEEIIEILKSRESTIDLYEAKALPKNIVTRIIDLKDNSQNYLFKFQNKSIAEEQLKQLCFGDYNKIETPIKFISNSGAAYYLISLLLKTLNISRTEIQKAKIFILNDGNFFASYCDTEKYRYPLKNKDAAFLIDSIFEN